MSDSNKCPQCGANVEAGAANCKYCGEALAVQQQAQVQGGMAPGMAPPPAGTTIINHYGGGSNDGIDASWPIKDKMVAGLLGILIGGLGVHKFYLGQVGMGILYLLFCWTGIPSIIGLIEGIVYLTSTDHNFQVKNRVRIG